MRGCGIFAAAVLVTVMTGCGDDVPALEAAQKKLIADRDELAQLAQSLDEYKSDVARLQSAVELLDGAGDPEPNQIETIQAGAAKTVKIEEPEEGGFTVSGPGTTTELAMVAELAPFLPVAKFDALALRWVFEVPLSDATVPVPVKTPPREYGAADIPQRHLRSLRSVSLRDEIEALQKEIAGLQKPGADAVGARAKKAELEAVIDRANRPDRLRAVARVAELLYGGAKPPCRGGSIRTDLEKMTFDCAAAPDAKSAAEALKEIVVEGYTLELSPVIKAKGPPVSADPVGSGRFEIVSGAFQRKRPTAP